MLLALLLLLVMLTLLTLLTTLLLYRHPTLPTTLTSTLSHLLLLLLLSLLRPTTRTRSIGPTHLRHYLHARFSNLFGGFSLRVAARRSRVMLLP